ncbi:hypothetical protein FDA94_29115 [Herbidospora galbida]|uniref:Zinc finger CHC2-type domain-containing protein n=1 Tax=Herbidospora galbida TaxID=2575442 RepID=A0A4U3MAR7_9ACTN|nr:toprim domain-containing protein [Herbidospora galbida]TKK84676.1 hypothetical protein FDA94_29115 [Herbidospora galbida]
MSIIMCGRGSEARRLRDEPLVVPGDVLSAVEKLGLEIIREDGDEITCRCPAHEARLNKPDRNPSFSINSDTGLFLCWSCGYAGAFVHLARDMLAVDLDMATAWVRAQGTIGATIRMLERAGLPKEPVLRPISRASLALCTAAPERELRRRGINPDIAADYRVMWDPATDSWVLPMWDPDSTALIGWQEKRGSRVRNYPKGLAKRNETLFGVHLPPPPGPLVVVESPLDAAIVGEVAPGAVATWGSKISDTHIDLIADRATGEVITMLDNDEAGWQATSSLIRGLRGRVPLIRTVTWSGLPRGTDPGGYTHRGTGYLFPLDELAELITEAIPSYLIR